MVSRSAIGAPPGECVGSRLSRRADEPVVIMDGEERFEGFENLMLFKVHNILLVSSLYDSFILREDDRLNELLIDQSLDLNLQQIPRSYMLLWTSRPRTPVTG